eukprot:417641-Prymnesium_polylepis.1
MRSALGRSLGLAGGSSSMEASLPCNEARTPGLNPVRAIFRFPSPCLQLWPLLPSTVVVWPSGPGRCRRGESPPLP